MRMIQDSYSKEERCCAANNCPCGNGSCQFTLNLALLIDRVAAGPATKTKNQGRKYDYANKPSRFNARAINDAGELVVYNSLTGAIGAISSERRELASKLLSTKQVDSCPSETEEMAQQFLHHGFLVNAEEDEYKAADEFHKEYFSTGRDFQLIILPTEQCNFRCVYCYESFIRGEMKPSVIQSVKNLIDQRIPTLKTFTQPRATRRSRSLRPPRCASLTQPRVHSRERLSSVGRIRHSQRA